MKEIKKTEYSDLIRTVSLGSRKQLCIHERVSKYQSANRINEACLEMQKGKS